MNCVPIVVVDDLLTKPGTFSGGKPRAGEKGASTPLRCWPIQLHNSVEESRDLMHYAVIVVLSVLLL
jgi:hypothetical protein